MAYFKRKQVEEYLSDESKKAEVMTVPISDVYNGWYLECLHTGSRVICDPPPTGTDDDYMFLVHEGHRGALEARLKNEGFTVTGDEEYPNQQDENFGDFKSFRKDELNILLTESEEYYSRWSNATRLAQKLNLLKKEDRVTLFEAVTRDVWPKKRAQYSLKNNPYNWYGHVEAGGIAEPNNGVWVGVNANPIDVNIANVRVAQEAVLRPLDNDF